MCERALVDQGFLDIVRLACRSQAEDPRDLVFGLLGLVTAAAAEKTASPIPEPPSSPTTRSRASTSSPASSPTPCSSCRTSACSATPRAYPAGVPTRPGSPPGRRLPPCSETTARTSRPPRWPRGSPPGPPGVLERAPQSPPRRCCRSPGRASRATSSASVCTPLPPTLNTLNPWFPLPVIAAFTLTLRAPVLQVSTAHRKWTTVEGRWLIDDIDGCYERTAPLTFDHYRSVELSVPASEIDVGLQCGKLWHQQAEIDVPASCAST